MFLERRCKMIFDIFDLMFIISININSDVNEVWQGNLIIEVKYMSDWCNLCNSCKSVYYS